MNDLQNSVKEKSILLSFSNDIADISNRKDLFEVVVVKVKKIFAIERFLIAKINEDGTTFSAFAADPEGNAQHQPDYTEIASANYEVNDPVFGRATISEDPVLFDVYQLADRLDAPVYADFWKRIGLRYVLIVALRTGKKHIGFAILNFSDKDRIDTKSALLKGICAQLAGKVSNILAHEEIAGREKEKSILLELSNEIAAIRNRSDFFDVVNTQLKLLFGIKEFGIAQISPDGETYDAFLLELEDAAKEQPDYEKITGGKYQVGDPVFSQVIHSDDPVLLDVNLLAEEPGMPEYVGFWKIIGLSHVLGVALRVGGKNVGCAFLHVDKDNTFDPKNTLLKSVCAQISVKVLQILTTEEITKREREKTILLSFSTEIANIRDRKGFFDVVIARIKKIFSIDRFSIAKINEDGKTLTTFALDPVGSAKGLPGHNNIAYSNYPVDGRVFNEVIQSEGPILFDIDHLAAEPEAPPYVGFWKQMGARYVLVVGLRTAGNLIGFGILYVNSKDSVNIKSSLLSGICTQLSVKISTILANEEIEKREQEKSMLLAFSNAIASERDKKALAKILRQQLKMLFNIDDYVIHALSDDKKFHTPILFDPDADFAGHPDFTKLLHSWTTVNDGIYNITLASEDPVVFNAEEWTNSPTPPAYANAAKAIGLKRMTGMALRLGQENIGLLNFKVDDLNIYAIQERLFKSICSQIAITLANIIAGEKVNRQLSEINKLRQLLEEEKTYLKEEIETSLNYTEIIGESPEIKKVFRMVAVVAYSDTTALLLGETGTGKELIARAIHNASPRKNKLMIKVNCAAIPANLIESELFGHERGSFTGAVERRIGKFELANHGTLFLDEIGEMTLDLQVKILRALQEKEIERVGGKTTIKTDARIIAATNRDLEKLMEEGKFRSDLYYRLNTFPILIPALRNRKDDIPKLALYFLDRYAKKTGKKIRSITNKALQELMLYDWPGNIRELEHLIERSVLLADGDSIHEIHLPLHKKITPDGLVREELTIKTIDENEREHILKILKHVGGRIGGKGGAAELLGLPTSTLNSRIKKLGIRREHS